MFLFRLALTLGYPHPDYLIQYLSSYQLTEWMAYFLIEPFGPRREDERAGVLASTTIQPHLKRGKKISGENFFPDRAKIFASRRKKQSWQEQLKILMPLVKDK